MDDRRLCTLPVKTKADGLRELSFFAWSLECLAIHGLFGSPSLIVRKRMWVVRADAVPEPGQRPGPHDRAAPQ